MVEIGGVVNCSHWTLVLAGTGKLWMVIFWFRVVLLAGGEERGEGFLQPGMRTILYLGSCCPPLWHGATRLKYSRNLGDIKVYYMCFRLPSKDIKRTMENHSFQSRLHGLSVVLVTFNNARSTVHHSTSLLR